MDAETMSKTAGRCPIPFVMKSDHFCENSVRRSCHGSLQSGRGRTLCPGGRIRALARAERAPCPSSASGGPCCRIAVQMFREKHDDASRRAEPRIILTANIVPLEQRLV